MRLRRARGSAELKKVASGSATQGLWLKDRKVGSQVIVVDRSRFPGKEQLGKLVEKEDEEDEPAKKRVYRFRVRFRRERRASRLPCLHLGLGDDRRSTPGSGDVSLAIFITSVSGSESIESFTNRFFDFSRPPGFGMVFDAAERNKRFGRILCQRSKKSSSRGKRKKPVFLCRKTMRVKVRSNVIPASFLKIEGRGTLAGQNTEERGTDKRLGR